MDDNKYFDLDADSHDFGFTFDNETDITPITGEVDDLKQRLQAIRKIYLPLLQNLAKNPDQPMIKWPDRGPVLKKQIDKLVMLTEPGFGSGKSAK
jgi:hypothetical protein